MSGGSNESNTVAKYEPPEFTNELWREQLDRANALSTDYGSRDLAWGGPYVSPFTLEQVLGINSLSSMTAPLINNPWRFQEQYNQQYSTLMSALNGGMQNKYGGSTNPEFEKMLANTRNSMTEAAQRGPMAQTNALAAMSGGYGGSAHQQQTALNAAELGKQVGAMESGLRSDQFNRAAGLQENAFNRQMQALGLMPAIQAGNVNQVQALMDAGELSRSLNQQDLEGRMGAHYQRIQQPIMALNLLQDALIKAGGGGGQNVSSLTSGYNPVQLGIGGLLGLAGLLGGR